MVFLLSFLLKLALYMGFDGGHRVAPADLNHSGVFGPFRLPHHPTVSGTTHTVMQCDIELGKHRNVEELCLAAVASHHVPNDNFF